MGARGDSPTACRVSPLVFANQASEGPRQNQRRWHGARSLVFQNVLWDIIPKRKSRFYLRPPGGFTLIELMIVVAIIGILSAIVAPKFADMLRKAKESSTKGSLGAARGALRIYYADMEGHSFENAASLSASPGPFLTKYLNQFPSTNLGLPDGGHQNTSAVLDFTAAAVNADGTGNPGGWFYDPASAFGKLLIGCTHTDTKLAVISTW